MTELNGTVAVVTGAGRGIGREIALHQAQGGAKVAVLARTPREIDETASLITGAGGAAIAVPVDLVDRLAVEDALARVTVELGAIDLVVNNHGSFRAFDPIWSTWSVAAPATVSRMDRAMRPARRRSCVSPNVSTTRRKTAACWPSLSIRDWCGPR